jgi:hypothetical protein
MRYLIVGGFVALAAAWTSPASAQINCTSRWNPIGQQYETNCSDGSREVDRYNRVLNQWESNRTPGPQMSIQQPQHCVRRYNAMLRQWETQCN